MDRHQIAVTARIGKQAVQSAGVGSWQLAVGRQLVALAMKAVGCQAGWKPAAGGGQRRVNWRPQVAGDGRGSGSGSGGLSSAEFAESLMSWPADRLSGCCSAGLDWTRYSVLFTQQSWPGLALGWSVWQGRRPTSNP